jgi:putative two-component system response regulator
MNEASKQIRPNARRPQSKSSPRILVVDDDQSVLSSLVEYLKLQGFDCEGAEGPASALELMASSDNIGIVVSDLKMPGQSGLALLAELQHQERDDLEFILMTGYGDVDSAVSALRLGATDYLLKPLELQPFLETVQRAAKRYALRRSRQDFRHSLAIEVKRRSIEVQQLKGKIEGITEESARHLATAAECRDSETGAHNWRLGTYSAFLASCLDWSRKDCRLISFAAPLHDIGKIGIPDSILMKPGPLTEKEFTKLQDHCTIGLQILSNSDQPMMVAAAEIARSHHECWDGSGYPEGLAGEQIPHTARIVALGDVYDALRSIRPYKPAMEHRDAIRVIMQGDERTRPEQFDPQLLSVLQRNHERFDEIYNRSRYGSARTP